MSPVFLPPAVSRGALAFAVALVLALPPAARAQDRPDATLQGAAQRHAKCAAPAFRASAVDTASRPSGYGIEVRGEPYWVAVEERSSFALLLPGGDEAVAQVKIDRPPAGDFDEQATWRQRWLEDVAARTGVEPVRQPLAEGASLLTVNKKALAGRAVGISLLSDPRRRLFVQWEWPILPRYGDIGDVAAMQSAVWARLLPCMLGS